MVPIIDGQDKADRPHIPGGSSATISAVPGQVNSSMVTPRSQQCLGRERLRVNSRIQDTGPGNGRSSRVRREKRSPSAPWISATSIGREVSRASGLAGFLTKLTSSSSIC